MSIQDLMMYVALGGITSLVVSDLYNKGKAWRRGSHVADRVRHGDRAGHLAALARRNAGWLALAAYHVAVFKGRVPIELVLRYGSHPFEIVRGEWYRLVTPAFVHQDLGGLAEAVVTLALVGRRLERRVGTARFVGLYLVAAFLGSAAEQSLGPNYSSSTGGSAAGLGMLAAFLVLERRRWRSPLYVICAWGVADNVAFAVSDGFVDRRPYPVRHVAHFAHAGGLVAGLVLAAVYAASKRSRRPAAVAVGGAVALVGLGAAMLAVGIVLHPPRGDTTILKVPVLEPQTPLVAAALTVAAAFALAAVALAVAARLGPQISRRREPER